MPSSRLSFTDRQRMGAEGLETAALRELLSRRRASEFVGARSKWTCGWPGWLLRSAVYSESLESTLDCAESRIAD